MALARDGAEIATKMLEALKHPMLWTFLVALFGGVVAATITVCSTRSLARSERKRDRLHSQLTLLYGPVYYFVMQNKKLFELNKRFHEAYDKELKDKNWAQDEHTQKAVGEIASTTLGMANEYMHGVVRNNERIKKILDQHFGLCDPGDMDSFNLFFEHYVRYKTEIEESGKLKTPMRIYHQVGDISFSRPEFMQQIEERCRAKQQEYLELTS